MPRSIETFVSASSGGKLDHILGKAGHVKSDFKEYDKAVIIAGANDTGDFTDKVQNMEENIPVALNKFVAANSQTNIIYVTQPYRFNLALILEGWRVQQPY